MAWDDFIHFNLEMNHTSKFVYVGRLGRPGLSGYSVWGVYLAFTFERRIYAVDK